MLCKASSYSKHFQDFSTCAMARIPKRLQISGKTSLCGYHHVGIDLAIPTIKIQMPLY